MYSVGIDLGGTTVKGCLCDREGGVLYSGEPILTAAAAGRERVFAQIADFVRSMIASAELDISECAGVGLGIPGTVDEAGGRALFAGNLGWTDVEVVGPLERLLGRNVRIANDADAAAFGELRFGAAKGASLCVLVTLGTGVGSGVVFGGDSFLSVPGAELGHMVTHAGGQPCPCGRRGCFEQYVSATALIRETRRAMREHPESELWKCGGPDFVSGKTAFSLAQTDETARGVIDRYVEELGVGLVNVCNVFRPSLILLGGGISGEGEGLLLPLRKIIERERLPGVGGVRLEISELGNRAGMLGAAALWSI